MSTSDGTALSKDTVMGDTDVIVLGVGTCGEDLSPRLLGSGCFIPVDERMRAADGICAMGDVTGKAMLTHVAVYQAAIIGADILGEDVPPAHHDAVPRVTFADTEVTAVGMTESQAVAAGVDVAVVVKQVPASCGWLHSA